MHILMHIAKLHSQEVIDCPVTYTFRVVCESVHLPTPIVIGYGHSFFSLRLSDEQ